MSDKEVFENQEDEPRSSKKKSSVKVKMLGEGRGGYYVVIDDADGFYLVETQNMDFSVNWQDIDPKYVQEKPYNFSKMLKGMNLTKKGQAVKMKDCLESIYRAGITTEDASMEQIILALNNRGITVE